MKKLILSILGMVLGFTVLSQIPQAVNYQAVLRNDDGSVVSNTNVNLKIEIIAETGNTAIYSEIHETSTNEFGLINFQIGTGKSSDDFTQISWGADSYKVQVSFDEQGTGNYIVMGSSPLSSVPYALYALDTKTKQQLTIDGNIISLSEGGSITLPAGTSFSGSFNDLTDVPTGLADGDDNTQLTESEVDAFVANNGYLTAEVDGSVTNELQAISISNDTIYLSDGGFIKLPEGNTFSGDYNDLTNKPVLLGDVSGDYSNTTVNKIQGMEISTASPADGQILKWNNTTSKWEPSEDALGAEGSTDGVVTSAEIVGTSGKLLTLNRSNGLGAITVGFVDEVDDGDNNPFNEIQDLSLSGNILSLSGGVTTVDLSLVQDGIGTDDQAISLSGNTLTLEDGGTVDLSGYLDNTDTQLTEAEVDTYVSNNGYLTSEVDGSVTNEIQDLSLSGTTLMLSDDATTVDLSILQDGTGTDNQAISLSGNTLTLEDGGTVDLSGYLDNTDTQLTEAEVDTYVSNNGYLTSEVDGSITNELQDLSLSGTTLMLSDDATTVDLSILQDGTGTDNQAISLSGNTLTLEDGGTVDLSGYLDNTDTQLTEAEVDTYVSNNGYLTSEVDGSVTNEIQDLSLSGTTLMLSDDATTVDLSILQDGTGTDNQAISLSGNTLTLEDGGTVDLSGYLDNTDTQLTEAEVDTYVSNNGYLTSEVDGSVTNEIQDLSLSGNTLSLSDDVTSVDLSGYLDNTDTQLTEAEVDTYVSNNGYLTSEVDGSVTNEIQDLSLSGTTLSLSDDATTVDLSILQDGTGTDDQTLAEVLSESNDAGAENITNLADPVSDQDAATKAYVDMLKSQIETLENSMIEAGTYKLYDVDGNSYNVVKIGDQVWMAENLKVTTYPDGTPIPEVTDDNISGSTNDEWAALADDNVSDAYCYYNDNASSEGDTYGVLYTYAAATADNWAYDNETYQGVCPDGWHLPSDAEFSELNNALSYPLSGADLKEAGTVHWTTPNTGATNSSEFTALPGGSRFWANGTFMNLNTQANFWSRDYWNASEALYYFLKYDSAEFFRGTTVYSANKSNGYSVRCIKD